MTTPGQALDAALSQLATKDELRTEIRATKDELRAEIQSAKNEILAAINGGIDRLRVDLNTEFAKHRIPVKLATKAGR